MEGHRFPGEKEIDIYQAGFYHFSLVYHNCATIGAWVPLTLNECETMQGDVFPKPTRIVML